MPLPKFGIFWPGRNTSQVQSGRNPEHALKLACKNPSTGAINKVTGECNTPVVIVKLVGKDLADANSGKWIRTRADGSRNSSAGDYAFRPGLQKLAKDKDF